MDWPTIDLRALLGKRPTCGECREREDAVVGMTPEVEYVPQQRVYADVWLCPECGHMAYRGEDPTLYEP